MSGVFYKHLYALHGFQTIFTMVFLLLDHVGLMTRHTCIPFVKDRTPRKENVVVLVQESTLVEQCVL